MSRSAPAPRERFVAGNLALGAQRAQRALGLRTLVLPAAALLGDGAATIGERRARASVDRHDLARRHRSGDELIGLPRHAEGSDFALELRVLMRGGARERLEPRLEIAVPLGRLVCHTKGVGVRDGRPSREGAPPPA